MGAKRKKIEGAFSPDVTEVKEIMASAMRRELERCPVLRLRIRYTSQEKNDVVMAFRQAVVSAGVIRYGSGVYVFNGRYYSPVPHGDFDNVMEALCEEFSLPLGLWDTVKRYAWSKAQDLTVERDRSSRSVLCFWNGVVDFSSPAGDGSFVLEEHSPRFAVFFEMPYAYNPKAKCPAFHRFIERVLPEKEMRENLQELCGCIFVDRARYRIEKMGVLWGPGGNGKSTFAETLMNVIGRGNVSHFDLKDLSTGTDREKNIKHIAGKLLNYCTEITSRAINSPNVKALISMEPQMGRAVYQSPETVYDLPMLFGNVNELPRISGAFRAISRRMAIYPFTVNIPREEMDVTLPDRLRTEYPGILNWIMEGLSRLRDNNWVFTRSEGMEAVVRGMEQSRSASSDPFAMFLLDSRWRPDPVGEDERPVLITVGNILEQYLRWARYKGVRTAKQTALTAGRAMGAHGYRKKRASDGSGAVQYLVYGKIKEW